VRILLADDHAIVRAGLRQILGELLGRPEIGEAESSTELARQLAHARWDVLVLDLSMPGGGLELLKEVRMTYPALPVLVLSMHPEEQYAVRALRAGASGYVSKDAEPEVLAGAIRKVAGGGRYISETVAEQLAMAASGAMPAASQLEQLSDRELSVLARLGAGKTVGEIADDLGLSVKTVSTYRARLLQKLGLQTSADLTRYAIEHKITA